MIPRFKHKDYIGINGVGEKQLLHPHFEIWQKYFINEYTPPKNKIGVFIPCSAIKPYYNSPIHKAFNEVIDKFPTHKIVISNAGIIPYEFAGYYPFDSYDWNPAYETNEIRKRYIEISYQRLNNYLNAHRKSYKSFISYLHPKSDSLKALIKSAEHLNINIRFIEVEEISLEYGEDMDLILTLERNLKKLLYALQNE